METIEERAVDFGEKHYLTNVESERTSAEDGYITGAKEQKDIDAERAVEVHCKLCGGLEGYCDICPEPDKIRQLMKEDKI